jgi:hypothetical protein
MDLAVLESPPDTLPPDVDPQLWLRYVKGAKAFDLLYGSGKRCPNNGQGTRCKCDIPKQDYCRYFCGVADLAKQIGGATAEIIGGME